MRYLAIGWIGHRLGVCGLRWALADFAMGWNSDGLGWRWAKLSTVWAENGLFWRWAGLTMDWARKRVGLAMDCRGNGMLLPCSGLPNGWSGLRLKWPWDGLAMRRDGHGVGSP